MEGKTMNQDFKNAMEFLLFSYFGDISDPIMAAINRAYVDMASHTLTGFKEDENKWECREQASNMIHDAIDSPQNNDFDSWHDNLCNDIIKEYKESNESVDLSYGQAQKWVNMTLKYLYIFNSIDEHIGFKNSFNDYNGYNFSFNKDFFKKFGIKKFHVPIDSYILGHIKDEKDKKNETNPITSDNKLKNNDRNVSWSKMEKRDYSKVRELTKELCLNIENENHAWIQYALTKKPDKNSYAGYLWDKNNTNEE